MRRITSLFALVLFIGFFTGCRIGAIKTDNSLGKYFTENGVTGCFALFNNGTGKITVYNRDRYFDSTYLPASTFKIVNSLIGLQTGVISSDTMVIKWDSVERDFDSWNKDLTMYEAFRVSSVPYYQEVARRIGRDTMQFWLDTLGYAQKHGRTILKGPIDSFWLNSEIKVTPDEQLGMIKMLYFKQLPFFPVHQETVKNAMLIKDTATYKLSYKTGWGSWEEKEKRHIGWALGWIEENRHPYFFVLNIESHKKDFDMPAVRLKILNDILKHLGFFEGKM